MKSDLPSLSLAEAGTQRVRAFAVDMASFAHLLRCHYPDSPVIAGALYRAAHGRPADTAEEFASVRNYEGLPATLPYGPLLDALPGAAALLALECIDEDINYALDVLIHGITHNFTLPMLADAEHPAYEAAYALNAAYRLWAGRAPGACEHYAQAAMTFKEMYLGWDVDPGIWCSLLEALPIDGVDDRCAHGPRPALRWQALGHYMATVSAEGRMIEALRQQLEEDDPSDEADSGLEAWWNETLDAQIEAIEADQLAGFDDKLKNLIVATLAIHTHQ